MRSMLFSSTLHCTLNLYVILLLHNAIAKRIQIKRSRSKPNTRSDVPVLISSKHSNENCPTSHALTV